MNNTEEFDWYSLDNVGIYYASLKNKKNPTVFRYTATLNDNIDENILEEALKKTIDIYPNFNVTLHRGLFWYYLEEERHLPPVKEEHNPVCFRVCNNEDDILYRVSYYKKRINFEVSHMLSDGRGTLEVFKTLVSYYISIKYNINSFKISSSSVLEKREDSFMKNYKGKVKASDNVKNIYHYKGKKYNNKGKYSELHLSVDKLLKVAHQNNTTLTGIITSIFIESCMKEMAYKDKGKYIKINMPVDLRNYFNSNSSRNFFGVTNINYQYNGKVDDYKKIVSSVKKQMDKKITYKNLTNIVDKLVSFQKNYAVRAIPIFIKNYALRAIDEFNSNKTTATISNIGRIEFPKNIEKYITGVSVMPTADNIRLTICSYQSDLVIIISDQFVHNNIVKHFVRSLTSIDDNLYIIANEV